MCQLDLALQQRQQFWWIVIREGIEECTDANHPVERHETTVG
jgi:hypothetical protein